MQKPIHDDPNAMCPQWRKKCIKVCHTCELWGPIRIVDPMSPNGAEIDKWMCAFNRVAALELANLQAQRQTKATVQELRNDVDKQNAHAMVGAISHLNTKMQRVIDGGGTTPDYTALDQGQATPKLIGH